MKTLTPENEEILSRVARDERTPAWVQEILVSKTLDAINIETRKFDNSYLEFLEEQIQLAPRGPEWAQLLADRLVALRPFVGKPVHRISVDSGTSSFVANLDHSNGDVIHSEHYEC